MRIQSLAPVLAIVLASCGGSRPPTSPSSTSPPPTTGAGAPTVTLDVKADGAGSRDAIASLSEVIVDASGSSGTGLTFAIDFGDGASATGATVRHTYTAAGTFMIVCTATDTQGRKATGSSQVSVKAMTGRWFQAQYVDRSKRVEIRRLTIAAQDGTSLRGTYQTTGDADRSVTGTLTPPRNVRLVMNGGAALEGVIPDRLDDPAGTWPLSSTGDTLNGRLEFRPIVGDPTGAPPVADMKMRFGNDNGWRPIPAVTPVQIDGTSSQGTDLSYFIEFGDGFAATTSQATRVVDIEPYAYSLTARLTVVDRFGRSDSRSRDYYFLVMPAGGGGDSWFTGYLPDGALWMTFPSRSGATYSVSFSRNRLYPQPGYFGSGSAIVSGYDDIRVTIPALGIEFRGKITIDSGQTTWLTVVQYGGPDDGRTWKLYIRSYS
jgi:PKD domain